MKKRFRPILSPLMISGHFPAVTEKCTCGNLHVSGKKCHLSPHLGVSRSLLQQMSENPNTIFQLRSGSIGISDSKIAVCQKVRNNVFYISCVKCNQVFVVFIGRGSIYGQFSNDLIKDRLRLSEAMLNNTQPRIQFPPMICQLIRVDEITRDSAVGYSDNTLDIGLDAEQDHVQHEGDSTPLDRNEDGEDFDIYSHETENGSNVNGDANIESEMILDGNDNDLDYELMFSKTRNSFQGSYQAPSALGLYM